jgi:hypothetical protein
MALEPQQFRYGASTLVALLLWGLMIGVFYRLSGGDLAEGLRTGSLAAGAIGFLVMFQYRPLLAMVLAAAALWSVIAVESALDTDVRPGDQPMILIVGAILVGLMGAAAVSMRRAHSKTRRLAWIAGFVCVAQLVILAPLAYLSNGHRAGAAVMVAAVVTLALVVMVWVGFSRQYRDVENAWLAAMAYTRDGRTLRPAFRWLALAAGVGSGAFSIFMFLRGNVETRIEVSIICCPSTLAMGALAMGAPSLAGAIMRGRHEAHTLREPDERR